TPGTPPVAGQRGFGFAWVTGEPLTFMNWNGGEPNDSGGEDAVHLTGGAGVWNDQNAGVTAGETDSPLAGIAEFDLNLASAAPATGTQGFNYREVKSTGTISSVATAEALLAGTGVLSSVSGIATVANQLDSGGDGHFGNNDAFLLGGDNYATEYTGKVYIPTAGDWTFGTNSDDGSFLQVGDQIKIDDVLSGAHDNFMTFNFAEAGFYDIRAVFFEAGGGAEFELFAAQGALGAFDGSFRLVGDTANGGLLVLTDVAVTPEPATLAVWSMLGVALAGFGYYRTRRKQ
ncbi:MAG: hypothetical protein KDA41_15690, partial [Planctomycetales bacterium]|nr:hypothetical protein [Planctomycetales bacterium]